MDQDLYKDKARGMLIGLAVGDALGAPVEFGYSSSDIRELGGKISHYQDSVIGPAGTWTDDTSMALCLADSLIDNRGYDSYDIMTRYWRWMTEGYRTPDDKPAADVGIQTRSALVDFTESPIIQNDAQKTNSAGNGAIMRLAPIVLAGFNNQTEQSGIHKILELARLSCRETHNSDMAVAVTEAFAAALFLTLKEPVTKSEILEKCTHWFSSDSEEKNKCKLQIQDAIAGAIRSKDGSEFRDLGGYILDAFAIALWGLMHSECFEDGMLKIIRLGGDTDTNAAIYGQLAGSFYGYSAIPKEWRDGIIRSKELVSIADKLLDISDCKILRTRFEDDEHFVAVSGITINQ